MNIPLSIPELRGNEWQYVRECLDTGWVSSAGSFVARFEADLAAYTGARHAVACTSGTAALHVALQILGVKPGDEVIVPTLTFIATVNAVRYLGAEPVFMDCDEFYNLDPEKTAAFLQQETEMRGGACINRSTGRRVAAIVPVHVFGNAAALDALIGLCRERQLAVLEDATESLGTRYRDGRHTGALGDIGCFSFNGNKIITTGGGGMIVTDRTEHAARARYLTTQAKDDEVRYLHHEVGYNYRLTNLQAAIGVAQLELLPEFLAAKRRHRARYAAGLAGIAGLALAAVPPYADNNCWMVPLQIDRARYGRDRDALLAHLQGHGIQTRPVWHLNHLQKPYRRCQAYRIETAPRLLETTLTIPCSVGLRDEDLDVVVSRLRHE
ncbi:MAG: LegC family aminotransferase [Candidatus Krumholzibacteria bacterium]|jgi:aminotransferase in exopolysaccharide biosynthesis|nr:LegC family aminotransferase [Candidatus Krumholzibacteria bacterium]